MAQEASINDNEFDLWRKIALNFYDAAYSSGIADLDPPSWNDTQVTLQKKTAYYTAALAE